MNGKIRFGKSVIVYSVVKTKRRKTSEIIVDGQGVQIRTPITKNDSQIRQLVNDRKRWIFKKQLEFVDRKRMITPTRKPVTERYLYNRTTKLASRIGVTPSKITIKKLRSRWGSATKNNVITLNLALVNVPKKVIDYVIIHELCHLLIRNHSYKFWSLIRKYTPRYNEEKLWLENNSSIVVDDLH